MVLGLLAFYSVNAALFSLDSIFFGETTVYAYWSDRIWPLWCAAPVNGLFAFVIHSLVRREPTE